MMSKCEHGIMDDPQDCPFCTLGMPGNAKFVDPYDRKHANRTEGLRAASRVVMGSFEGRGYEESALRTRTLILAEQFALWLETGEK